MKCNKCGTSNETGARYCVSCGSPIDSVQVSYSQPSSAKKGISKITLAAIIICVVCVTATVCCCAFFLLSGRNTPPVTEPTSVAETTEAESEIADATTPAQQQPDITEAQSTTLQKFTLEQNVIDYPWLTEGTACKVNDNIDGYTGLTLRTGPGKNYDKITTVPCGAQLVILLDYDDSKGDYIKVRYKNYEGWLISSELEPLPEGYEDTTKMTSQSQSTDGITTEQARKLFKLAQAAFQNYYVNPRTDEYDTVVVNNIPYSRVLGTVTTMDDLDTVLHEHFDNDTCSYIKEAYTEHNGNLYFVGGGFGLEETYDVKSDSLVRNGNGWDYEMICDVSGLNGSWENEKISYKMTYENGNYVFRVDETILAVLF